MINTYQTSLAPPPVPPRLNRSHPVLIPAGLPSPRQSKPLLRFLVGVVVLHLVLSVGGFIYLYHIETEGPPAAPGKVAFHSSEKQETYYEASAKMVFSRKTAKILKPGYLEWDIGHSDRRNINYYENSWLTVLESGDYFVYSRVTFSRGDSVSPLASRVLLRKNKTAEERVVTQGYCGLRSRKEAESIPNVCTVTQVDVVRLEEGNQLSVWVEQLSLVDYGGEVTAFGIYKL